MTITITGNSYVPHNVVADKLRNYSRGVDREREKINKNVITTAVIREPLDKAVYILSKVVRGKVANLSKMTCI